MSMVLSCSVHWSALSAPASACASHYPNWCITENGGSVRFTIIVCIVCIAFASSSVRRSFACDYPFSHSLNSETHSHTYSFQMWYFSLHFFARLCHSLCCNTHMHAHTLTAQKHGSHEVCSFVTSSFDFANVWKPHQAHETYEYPRGYGHLPARDTCQGQLRYWSVDCVICKPKYCSQPVLFSRNVGLVTQKIIYFHCQKKPFLDPSIQKLFYFILKKEALFSTPQPLVMARASQPFIIHCMCFPAQAAWVETLSTQQEHTQRTSACITEAYRRRNVCVVWLLFLPSKARRCKGHSFHQRNRRKLYLICDVTQSPDAGNIGALELIHHNRTIVQLHSSVLRQ